ncbi:LysR family transcriptional regulator [Amycolatopsis regifaucium]|uniref:LysR family transcriptional regulator n=1 Tax=Amycolatopsis regifaucium TaxID=546365 RepID=A0A154MFS1_9PSEU|nr:LysR family transcriptional regulator [Amycolatopsis regifaucium]KZB83374.1 LysR family transcriptional regulator [Amycolatopsis regifaucium]OKA08839.1 LysR family transcriptional regulator [Amycolatopsis regifaucium]SFI92595.1 ModE molybdate transport repressor domain-containing protein [Amycolatopsis regifaucium]
MTKEFDVVQLDVHHLRVIRAIADTGSLSRAAIALGVTQPAVSTQLKRLENMLGYQLFERREGGVTPTPMGELLLRRTAALLPQLDNLLEDIEQRVCPSGPPDVVRVAAVASALVAHLPSLVTRLWPEVAEVQVVHDDHPERLLPLLAQRRAELGLVKEYPGHELEIPANVATAVVVTEPTFVLLPEGHPLAGEEVVDLRALRDEPWVMVSDSSATTFSKYFADTCARLGFSPSVTHQVTSQQVALMVVRAGAIGLSQPICDPRNFGIVTRPLRGDVLPRRHILAWNRETFVAGRQVELLSAVVETYWAEAKTAPVYAAYLEKPRE